LKLWEGSYEGVHSTWLRWHDGQGRLVPTGAEGKAQAEELARREAERAVGGPPLIARRP
jgi:hypothetical protein